MEFPTIEEFAKDVAEKALDEYEYKGKTLRQWVEIIAATDTNVGTKDGTNLAEVGTDCISRQQAIDIAKELTITIEGYEMHNQAVMNYCAEIMRLQPIQPEPKRGKWIRDGHHIRCDQCGMYMCDTDREGDRIPTEFCSSCGAKMDEVTT